MSEIKFKKWIVLTSRSGNTYKEISKILDRKAFQVYSTKNFSKEVIESQLRRIYNKDEVLICLMGYMRILPADICEQFTVVNLHPAPIHLKSYEVYKGKDPIERYWEQAVVDKNIIHLWGSVLHVATAELDDGPVIAAIEYGCRNLEECYENSFNNNVKLWVEYLRRVI